MSNTEEIKHPYRTLNHTDATGKTHDPLRVVFDPLDRKDTWMEHAVLVPWATPDRLFGWVHPAAKPGNEHFMLHAAFIYKASVGMQRVDENRLRVVEGPRMLLPYDLISRVDIDIFHCPSLIWMKRQGPEMKKIFSDFVKQHVMPRSELVVAQPGDIPPFDPRNGAKPA